MFLICLFGVFTVQDITEYCNILEMKTASVYAPFASENIYKKDTYVQYEREDIGPVTFVRHLFCACGLWPTQTASCAGW